MDVAGGSVDLVGEVGPGQPMAPPDNPLGRSVDLGGSTNDPGLFQTRQHFAAASNLVYNLTFQFCSTIDDLNSATASFGGRSFDVSTASTDFARFSRTFATTGPLTGRSFLSFQGLNGDRDNSGIDTDIVQLRFVGADLSAVPEPSTWGLMILGFGAVGWSMRRDSTHRMARAL